MSLLSDDLGLIRGRQLISYKTFSAAIVTVRGAFSRTDARRHRGSQVERRERVRATLWAAALTTEMKRSEMWVHLESHPGPWDMIIVGGGATGVGVAIDAANRGYEVLLLEQSDFGKGTSSRSTKLVHGGVRYLEQGNIGLVMEALEERGLLLQNAPHLVRELAFVVPNYEWWEMPFYALGLKFYQLLAGKHGFATSRKLSRTDTLKFVPNLKAEGLRGGTVYYDGQFDDARLLIHMVATACEQGAVALNYVEVTGLNKNTNGIVDGVVARDVETRKEIRASAKAVINATGAFSDRLRLIAEPGATPMIIPSQGIHLVFDSSFLSGDSAIMVPHSSNGRVLFVIPWHGHTLVGTTDTPMQAATLEPVATDEEIDIVLSAVGKYLAKKPTRDDVLSVFAGVRPLVRTANNIRTAALSRDHAIQIDHSGLISVMGGKWTTYRRMAEDCVSEAATLARLPRRACATNHLRIHGSCDNPKKYGALSAYGSDADEIRQLIEDNAQLGERMHPALPYVKAEVIWAVRHEMARTIEDVLTRRTRSLFLNSLAAIHMAPMVATLMAAELGWSETTRAKQISAFCETASNYCLPQR